MMHQCDDCKKVFPDSGLSFEFPNIPDLMTRLEPGGTVPSGECECGALAYPFNAKDATGIVFLNNDKDDWSPINGATVAFFNKHEAERVFNGENDAESFAVFELDFPEDVRKLADMLEGLGAKK